jgi:hypothetical protein
VTEVRWEGWNPGEPTNDRASYEEWKAAKEEWLNNPMNARGRCPGQFPGSDRAEGQPQPWQH